MSDRRVLSFFAGALIANSAPHLASAVSGRRHLTPLAGRRSSAAVNAVWGTANLVAGYALLRRAAPRRAGQESWDSRLPAFEAGCVAWAAWMAASERLLRINHVARSSR